ncbi:hypothetical protein HDU98_002840 [Podochytrium sp. JEL0797]|nr:hypothetical protein HDU98_002840 [Podochytrium sp. JEL0797]
MWKAALLYTDPPPSLELTETGLLNKLKNLSRQKLREYGLDPAKVIPKIELLKTKLRRKSGAKSKSPVHDDVSEIEMESGSPVLKLFGMARRHYEKNDMASTKMFLHELVKLVGASSRPASLSQSVEDLDFFEDIKRKADVQLEPTELLLVGYIQKLGGDVDKVVKQLASKKTAESIAVPLASTLDNNSLTSPQKLRPTAARPSRVSEFPIGSEFSDFGSEGGCEVTEQIMASNRDIISRGGSPRREPSVEPVKEVQEHAGRVDASAEIVEGSVQITSIASLGKSDEILDETEAFEAPNEDDIELDALIADDFEQAPEANDEVRLFDGTPHAVSETELFQDDPPQEAVQSSIPDLTVAASDDILKNTIQDLFPNEPDHSIIDLTIAASENIVEESSDAIQDFFDDEPEQTPATDAEDTQETNLTTIESNLELNSTETVFNELEVVLASAEPVFEEPEPDAQESEKNIADDEEEPSILPDSIDSAEINWESDFDLPSKVQSELTLAAVSEHELNEEEPMLETAESASHFHAPENDASLPATVDPAEINWESDFDLTSSAAPSEMKPAESVAENIHADEELDLYEVEEPFASNHELDASNYAGLQVRESQELPQAISSVDSDNLLPLEVTDGVDPPSAVPIEEDQALESPQESSNPPPVNLESSGTETVLESESKDHMQFASSSEIGTSLAGTTGSIQAPSCDDHFGSNASLLRQSESSSSHELLEEKIDRPAIPIDNDAEPPVEANMSRISSSSPKRSSLKNSSEGIAKKTVSFSSPNIAEVELVAVHSVLRDSIVDNHREQTFPESSIVERISSEQFLESEKIGQGITEEAASSLTQITQSAAIIFYPASESQISSTTNDSRTVSAISNEIESVNATFHGGDVDATDTSSRFIEEYFTPPSTSDIENNLKPEAESDSNAEWEIREAEPQQGIESTEGNTYVSLDYEDDFDFEPVVAPTIAPIDENADADISQYFEESEFDQPIALDPLPEVDGTHISDFKNMPADDVGTNDSPYFEESKFELQIADAQASDANVPQVSETDIKSKEAYHIGLQNGLLTKEAVTVAVAEQNANPSNETKQESENQKAFDSYESLQPAQNYERDLTLSTGSLAYGDDFEVEKQSQLSLTAEPVTMQAEATNQVNRAVDLMEIKGSDPLSRGASAARRGIQKKLKC